MLCFHQARAGPPELIQKDRSNHHELPNHLSQQPDYVIEAEYTEISQKPLGTRLKNWLNSPCGGPSLERAMQQVETDRCHVFITAVAIRNVAALSDLESRVATDRPQNAYMCHALVESYAEGAVQMVLQKLQQQDTSTLNFAIFVGYPCYFDTFVVKNLSNRSKS